MVIKAVIELQQRPGDESLDKEALSALDLAQRLKKIPPVDRYPGSMVLRVFKKGAVICSQNETGHSAFYLPTTDDLLRLRRHQLNASQVSPRPDGKSANDLHDAIARLEGRKAALGDVTATARSSSPGDRASVGWRHGVAARGASPQSPGTPSGPPATPGDPPLYSHRRPDGHRFQHAPSRVA